MHFASRCRAWLFNSFFFYIYKETLSKLPSLHQYLKPTGTKRTLSSESSQFLNPAQAELWSETLVWKSYLWLRPTVWFIFRWQVWNCELVISWIMDPIVTNASKCQLIDLPSIRTLRNFCNDGSRIAVYQNYIWKENSMPRVTFRSAFLSKRQVCTSAFHGDLNPVGWNICWKVS